MGRRKGDGNVTPPNKEELTKLYLKDKWSTRKCAEHFGMSQPYIRKYMKEYGIVSRSISENGGHSVPRTEEWKAKIALGLKANNAMRGKFWEQHPNYKLGKRSYRKYMLRGFLPSICTNCGGQDNLIVHHVDHDRDNNEVDNLIVLCASCHKRHHLANPSIKA